MANAAQALLARVELLHPQRGAAVLARRFGTAGAVTTRAGYGDARAFGLTVTSDGKPLVAAWLAPSSGAPQLSLLQFTRNGDIDPSFGTAGVKRADFGSGTSSYGNDVALQADGLAVVTGHVSLSTETLLAVSRDSWVDHGCCDPDGGDSAAVKTPKATLREALRRSEAQLWRAALRHRGDRYLQSRAL